MSAHTTVILNTFVTLSVNSVKDIYSSSTSQNDKKGAQNDKKGFTLIELLVVISIIAILSVIGIVVFTGIQQKARNAKISSDFNAIYKNIDIARIQQQKTLDQLVCGGDAVVALNVLVETGML